MTSVVDTNVAIVANGCATDADLDCQLACVEKLESLVNEVVAVDEKGEIMHEYRKHLSYSKPGVGNVFYKHLFDKQYGDDQVIRVPVTLSEHELRRIDELPDRCDRKFLAVAVVASADILNATDGDWAEQEPLMTELGVEVRQLCPHYERRQR